MKSNNASGRSVGGGTSRSRDRARRISLLPCRLCRFNFFGLLAGRSVIRVQIQFLAKLRERSREISLQLEDYSQGKVAMICVGPDDHCTLDVGGSGINVTHPQFRKSQVEKGIRAAGVNLRSAAQVAVGFRKLAGQIIGIPEVIIDIPTV